MATRDPYDILVLGNGVVGLSTAVSIVRENPDASIAVVGPAAMPGNASLAAGAMLASFGEIEAGSLDHPIDRYVFDLNRKATALWPAWAAMLSEADPKNPLTINFGTYVINNTRADELDDTNYRALLETLAEFREPHEQIHPRDITGYNPATDSRALRACFIPGEGSLHSNRMMELLLAHLRRAPRVELVDDEADRIDIDDGGRKAVTTTKGTVLRAPQVVIACGTRSQKLIDQIPALRGRVPRMVFGIGTSLLVETENHAPEKTIRTCNRGLACGIHVVPYDKVHAFIGASNFISPVPEYHPRMTSLHALLEGAMEQVHRTYYKARVIKVNVGFRPTSEDTYPILGQTSIAGLWILSGTKRIGIHMSPLYGASFAREICGGAPLFENRFAPERAPIHTMTREQGIAKAVKHMKSAGFQHDFRPPKSGWDAMLDDMLRRRVEEVYEISGVRDYGIPPELLDMYRYGHFGPRAAGKT